jgi:hypothetical protein
LKAKSQSNTTAIGNQKGQTKAFAAAFEAKAEGKDVEFVETKVRWR